MTEARIRSALAAPQRARRGLLLNRSLELTQSVASALGGEAAGDARRMCELSYELAVVCRGSDVRATEQRLADLPQIVAGRSVTTNGSWASPSKGCR